MPSDEASVTAISICWNRAFTRSRVEFSTMGVVDGTFAEEGSNGYLLASVDPGRTNTDDRAILFVPLQYLPIPFQQHIVI